MVDLVFLVLVIAATLFVIALGALLVWAFRTFFGGPSGSHGFMRPRDKRLGVVETATKTIPILLQTLDLAADFGSERLVPFGELQHAGEVVHHADDLFQRLKNRPQRLELDDRLARLFLIVPKAAFGHAGLDGGCLPTFAVVVKDCPAVA